VCCDSLVAWFTKKLEFFARLLRVHSCFRISLPCDLIAVVYMGVLLRQSRPFSASIYGKTSVELLALVFSQIIILFTSCYLSFPTQSSV